MAHRVDHPRPKRPAAPAFLTIALLLLATALGSMPARAQEPWQRLPPTPTLPKPLRSGYAHVNGIRLWFAVFGHGSPVILLHGGLANANYWGLQVRALESHYEVIVMDSRGHGRSTMGTRPISYDLMASDVLALMDYLHIPRAAIVGWSDGAIIGLDLAIHHPNRVTKLFAFAANSTPSGARDASRIPVFVKFQARAKAEYEKLSPTPGRWAEFVKALSHMWATQPHFTDAQLRSIHVPTWIVDGDHDEAIKRENTDHMAKLIPDAREMILPGVSHFAFLQDPTMFNEALLHFLSSP